MSFLIETISRRMAVAPISRVAVASASRTRTFTTSIAARKSATETVKDGLKTVDRAVSDKIVDGIDAGGTFCLSYPFWRFMSLDVSPRATYLLDPFFNCSNIVSA